MKKLLSLLLPLLLITTIANAQVSTNTNQNVNTQAIATTTKPLDLKYNLRLGSTDKKTKGEVTKLQQFLEDANYLESDPTGTFDKLTRDAVKDFQEDSGIAQTGSIGPATRKYIKVNYFTIINIVDNSVKNINSINVIDNLNDSNKKTLIAPIKELDNQNNQFINTQTVQNTGNVLNQSISVPVPKTVTELCLGYSEKRWEIISQPIKYSTRERLPEITNALNRVKSLYPSICSEDETINSQSHPTVVLNPTYSSNLKIGEDIMIGRLGIMPTNDIYVDQIKFSITPSLIQDFSLNDIVIRRDNRTVLGYEIPNSRCNIDGTCVFPNGFLISGGGGESLFLFAKVNGTLSPKKGESSVTTSIDRGGFIWEDSRSGFSNLTGNKILNFQTHSYKVSD